MDEGAILQSSQVVSRGRMIGHVRNGTRCSRWCADDGRDGSGDRGRRRRGSELPVPADQEDGSRDASAVPFQGRVLLGRMRPPGASVRVSAALAVTIPDGQRRSCKECRFFDLPDASVVLDFRILHT
jgi:hypothetical protein